MTRQQIIDLIDEYIYTNGEQRITAAQLREILIDITNAFAMDGAASGIEAVLAAGQEVTDGRAITNAHGGSVLLSENFAVMDQEINYMGFDVSVPTHQTFSYHLPAQLSEGVFKRSSPDRDFLTVATTGELALENGEFVVGTSYLAEGRGEEIRPGVVDMAIDYKYRTTQHLQPQAVYTNISSLGNGAVNANINHEIDSWRSYINEDEKTSKNEQMLTQISTSVQDGDTGFTNTLEKNSTYWTTQNGEIARLNTSGFTYRNENGSTSFNLGIDGVGTVLTTSGRNTFTLNANTVFFKSSGTAFATFTSSAAVFAGGVNSKGVRSSINTSGTNVALFGSASGGVSNIAVMADAGDLVVKTGSAMFGFGEDTTPNAAVDIKSQGSSSAELALRVRNNADTQNILEVRGDGNVALENGRLLLGSDVTLYVSDETGNAAPHFRTGAGADIKLYQETEGVEEALFTSKDGTPLTDTDTFDGYTLRQIVKALRNQGLLH